MEIKVLGPGCANCVKLEKNVKEASKLFGFEHTITKISDYRDIMSYGVANTPALLVNNEIVSSGKVLAPADILKIVSKYVK
jgi:small redox-active disulfide protein 2